MKKDRLIDSVSRREFLKAAGESAAAAGMLSALASGAFAVEPSARPRKPNIVYVFPDQHRQCSWSMTDPQVKTPNLQALAGQSTTFSRCISTYPLCSPHRATMLTGRFPQSHTVTRNGVVLPPSELSIGNEFKNAGYATGYVGKWHLHGNPEVLVPAGPHRHGFDYWRVCTNYRDRYHTRYFDDAGKSIAIAGYAPAGQMDLTLDFIEKHAHEPFCVFLSWHPPHPPYEQAPAKYLDLYPAQKIQLRTNVPANTRPGRVRRDHTEYFGHVSAEDAEMGRLMQKLDELGIADNTIVCFSSDHGDMLGSRGRFGKNVPWEESINVPFIVRYPGVIPAGKQLDTLFSSVDIAPTLLGLAGLPTPPRMQGVDLSPIIRGEKTKGPESVFIMSDSGALGPDAGSDETETAADGAGGRRAAKRGVRSWRGVRTARHTYVEQGRGTGRKPALLYDNDTDPHQQHNLLDNADSAHLQEQLKMALSGWLHRVGEA
jgi:arylsulfatase A-like enzyme